MKITPETTVQQLLAAHPELLDFLASWAPEFSKLKNPVLRNTIGRAATLEAAASMADRPVADLMEAIERQLALGAIHGDGETGEVLSADERLARQETLKRIITRLHDGASVDDVKAEFDALVQGVDAAEVAAMEQALIAEGMPVEEVQRLCDVHVTVFKDALEDTADDAPLADDHPVSAYVRENAEIARLSDEARCTLDDLAAGTPDALDRLGAALEGLRGIDTHYVRKENQLFPVLESHGVEGPTKVMWALDDDIRDRLKTARALVALNERETLARSLPETLQMIDDMIYKEEKILFPTALQVVTDAEWDRIASGDAEIGFAFAAGADAPDAVRETPAPADLGGDTLSYPLTTGSLTLEQIDLMLRSLPFDVTYVDATDRVRFYSEGDRVFPRSPGAIGREVRNCHPPKSVHKVEEILAEFKAGTKDVAEFWIELGEQFIHIRYFALRDSAGTYGGCLEVVQDATHVRSLEGQRRIVDW